jgi:hemin uptake protein HemP
MEPKQSSSSSRDPVPDPGDAKGANVKRIIPSEEILQGEREVWIRHADAIYRLCLTRNGKLILQK